MFFRTPLAVSRRVWSSAGSTALRPMPRNCLTFGGKQRYGMATVVPPVTQDATGSKGPTAMVFLNMGGPSTTNEVEDFLGRLFVRVSRPNVTRSDPQVFLPIANMLFSLYVGRW